ncbi:hypothetical protein JYT22_00430 [Endomicrobium sp. AH-315-J14]|nr:hypothetical protein [Endomicrobium sp. AH-315-J14]
MVKASGYADETEEVEIRPSDVVEVEFELSPVETKEPLDVCMIGGFAGLGIGVVAGVIGMLAALDVQSLSEDKGYDAYRQQFTGIADVCVEAKQGSVSNVPGAASPTQIERICDDGAGLEIRQAVAFPLAAVAAGIGAYLLGTSNFMGSDGSAGDGSDEAEDDEEEEAKGGFSIQPFVGVDLQHIQLTYTF